MPSPRPATPQEVEVAVQMLYELGEGAPEESLRPNSGALAQLVLALMQVGCRLGLLGLPA